MPSREPELYKDKIEVSLDGRQIFYLFFGGAVIVGMVFVLGVLVGRRVEARGHLDRAETHAETDPLAALDRLERSDRLSFHGALRGGEAATDVEKAISDLEKRRAAAKPDKKPEPAVAAVAIAKADPKPVRVDKTDEPVTHSESDRARADRADKRGDAAPGEKKPKNHEVATETRLEARSDGKSDARSEPKSESKPESKSEFKPEAKGESKSESKSGSKPEKSDAKPDPRPDSKAERSDAKHSDGRGEKPATRSDTKADAKPDAKPDAKEPRTDKRGDTAAASSESRSDAAKPASEAKARFTLQLSSFQDKAEADAFLAATKSAGFQPYVVEADVTGKGTFYRVRLGSYRSLDAANDAKADYERTAKKTAQVTRL